MPLNHPLTLEKSQFSFFSKFILAKSGCNSESRFDSASLAQML